MWKNILLNLRNILWRLTDRKIIIPFISIFILSVISASLVFNSFLVSNTSALEYADNIGLEFTFNPTLSLSLSGNLMIDNLIPGSSSDSNAIDVNVSTNNVTGYNLSATVGSSNNATTNLTNGSNSNYVFTSLNANDSLVSLTNDNTWGYGYSVDNGTTWSNYSGLPLYTTTGTNLNTTSTNSSDTINFKIGARASNTQPLGEYTNVINFKAVTNPAPTTFTDAFTIAGKTKHNGYYTMQDMTHSICEAVDIDANIQLIDVRDDEIYTIAKLKDNNCWLLDNLRLDPTTANLTADNTNVADGEQGGVAFTAQDIIDNFINGGNIKTINGWNNIAISSAWHDSNAIPAVEASYKNDSIIGYGISNHKIGVYYNYCAATVGTYCYSNDHGADDAKYDICPINWRLPSGGPNGEFQNLYNHYSHTQNATDISSLQYNLSTLRSGNFEDFSQKNLNTYGYWWSSTHDSHPNIYRLYITANSVNALGSANPYHGFSIRCLAK